MMKTLLRYLHPKNAKRRGARHGLLISPSRLIHKAIPALGVFMIASIGLSPAANAQTEAAEPGVAPKVASPSISGVVWRDADGDGTRDEKEEGLEGVMVYLDLNGNGMRDETEPFEVTGPDGRYAFSDVDSNEYLVRVAAGPGTAVEGLEQTFPLDERFGGAHMVVLNEGDTVTDADFGFHRESPGDDAPRWFALFEGAEPGDPIRVETLKVSPTETTMRLIVPGVWVEVVEYGGEKFSKLHFPQVELGGLGFPQREGERGWYDFPEETGYGLLSEQKYRRAMEISEPKTFYPEEALDVRPESAEEMEKWGIDPAGARPGIPSLRGLLAVAPGTQEADLGFERVEAAMESLQLEYPLVPGGYDGLDQVREENGNEGYIAPQLIDERFYLEFEGLYTGTESTFSETSNAGFTALTQLSMPMVELNTVRELRVTAEMIFNVKFLQGGIDFDCPLNWDHWIFKFPFINGPALRESLSAKGLTIEASRSARYLILTPEEYREDLHEIALWKQSKGLNVEFAYVGSNPEDDVPADREAINDYLENYFKESYCHGVYVLLVGDVAAIPSGRSDRLRASPDFQNGSSDHAYSVLGDDRFSSMYVGRLSVANASQLKVQVDKILNYERGAPSVFGDWWPRRVTLAANSENDNGTRGVSAAFPSKYAQAVNEIAGYNNYSVQPDFNVLHAGASNATDPRATNQDVIDAVDAGTGHLLYRGHGDTTTWLVGWDGSSTNGASWRTTHIDQLSNGVQPIVYSIACQNNRIHLNSIGEHWMNREAGGAVAHYGASINSYTSENHERAKGIFRSIFEQGYTRLGPALAGAEAISHTATGGGNLWDNNTFSYLLLGDPEMTIRRNTFPDFRLVPHFQAVDLGVLISVSDNTEQSVSGALVNVELADGTSVNGFTSTDGTLLLEGLNEREIARFDFHADGYEHVSVEEQPRGAEISGVVWMDADGDGSRDEGEAGIEGVTVYLDLNGNGVHDEDEPFEVTGPEGRYHFTNVDSNEYLVRVVDGPGSPVEGLKQTYPVDDRFYGAHMIFVGEGDRWTDADFGFYREAPVDDSPRWIALFEGAEPGDPVRVETLKVSPTETTMRLVVPGVWVETVEYGGEKFSKLHFPQVELGGLGFPQREGERGWYDFPEETGYGLLSEKKYRHAMEISVPKPDYPESAMDVRPETADEMEKWGIDPAGARPGIPAMRGFLAVAPGTQGEELNFERVETVMEKLELEYPLVPAGYDGSDQVAEEEASEGYTPPQLIDQLFYREFEGVYAGTERTFSETSNVGFTAATQLSVPMAELIGAGDLQVLRDMTFTAKFLRGGVDFDCPLNWDHWIFKFPFINGAALRESLSAKGLKIEASRSARYLILTPEEYREDLNDFALWKQSKGLNVEFAYVGSGSEDDVPADRDAINEYLEGYFKENYCHGVYVLLVGDVETIPSGRSDRIDLGPDHPNGSSDHVYSVLGNDRFSSMYVGRLSVANAEQLNIQVDKILDYEQGVPSVFGEWWPRRVTLAASSENSDDTRGVSDSFPSKYAQAVNEIAGYNNYNVQPDFNLLHAGASNESDPRATNQDVIDAVDAGTGHLLYRGHGSTGTWGGGWDGSSTHGASWRTTHIDQLSNDVLPIVYSIACQNNRIRLNSIGEHWMNREGGGAVAHYGASVNSYTVENHERAKGIFRSIFERGHRRLGPALAGAEVISHTTTGGGNTWDNNTFTYLLLGDPEMTIRMNSLPNMRLVPHFEAIDAGVLISLFDNEEKSVSGALVNVELADGTSVNGFTSTDGTLLLEGLSEKEIARFDFHADGYAHDSRVVPESPRPRPQPREIVHDRESGRFSLQIEADPGVYEIQISDDMIHWETVKIIEVGEEPVDFDDDRAGEYSKRFYRIVEP